MAVRPEATLRNIEGSLNAWISAKLVTIEGLSVQLPSDAGFVPPAQWISVNYDIPWRSRFARQVDASNFGNIAVGLVQLLCAVRMGAGVNAYARAMVADKVRAYFLPGQSVPVKDYAIVGTPTIGQLIVLSQKTTDVDDGRTSGVAVTNIAAEFQYVEAFTYA